MYNYRQETNALPRVGYSPARRNETRHETRLPFSFKLDDEEQGDAETSGTIKLTGHTLDIGSSNISLVGPLIRFGYRHLMGRAQALHLTLHLPSGPIEIEATPTRYAQLEAGATDAGFIMSGVSESDANEMDVCCLIGVHIKRMNESDRARYDKYLYQLERVEAEQTAFIISIEDTLSEDALTYSTM